MSDSVGRCSGHAPRDLSLDPQAREFKKAYAKGRRELEHELGKTMRYRAIRELASGDSGKVINDLKPIWLMSPPGNSTDCSSRTWRTFRGMSAT
ncbi:hypothetical protein [Pseudomonas sp. NPDC088444]|uniref:hypothetical protein n=1 Tax=Pseudomonas sp. NPDC088444 TaxID=3364456 RepID=UPI00384F18A3